MALSPRFLTNLMGSIIVASSLKFDQGMGLRPRREL